MKKVLSMVIVLAMLACVFAVNVAAVDNYEPKTINLVANVDGTCSVPEGYVVYLGDTLVFPREDMVFIESLPVRIQGQPYSSDCEIRDMAVAVVNDINIYVNDIQIGSGWTGTWPLSNATISGGGDFWFESGAAFTAGKYTFKALSGRDTNWTENYWFIPERTVLEVEVIDPKTVDTIVLPPVAGTTPDPVVSEEAPVASEEAPVASEEAPVASTEDTTSTADTASTAAPTESKADDIKTDAPASANNTLIYIIIGAVAVVAVVVVIVLVSKKKK